MGGEAKTIPVFRPTIEEFTAGFSNYIKTIQPLCTQYGLAKIIPPKGWNQKKTGWFEAATKNMSIPAPIRQNINGMKGVYQQTNIITTKMKLSKFKKEAEVAEESRAPATSDEEIERRFWKNIRFDPPLYGADMNGSLFPPQLFHWNVARLTEQNLLKHLGALVDGVNCSYLYFGMWKAMFAWHTEDMDLFSINYLHHGEPKRWYVIPEAERSRFESLATSLFPDTSIQCKEFLRHKMTLISPTIIKAQSISIYTGVQREGEFIITLPGAYHAGFNHGFNCAESLNFAVESWISRGEKASWCKCKSDNVSINMDIFKRNYQAYKTMLLQNKMEEPAETPLAVPDYQFDHFELGDESDDEIDDGDEEDYQISITIPIPSAKKTIKKKKRKGKPKEPTVPSSREDEVAISFYELSSIAEDLLPTSPVPKSWISSLTNTPDEIVHQ